MFRKSDSQKGAPVAAGGAFMRPPYLRLMTIAIASSLLAGHAVAATRLASPAKAATKQKFSFDTPVASFQPPVSDLNKFSFTAAGNPAASARLQTQERAFRFTPSGQTDNRQALSLGVNTRVVAAAVDQSRAAASIGANATLPTAFGIEASVGWKGFAVNTGYRHVEPGSAALLGNQSDAVDVGLSYGGKNWKTRLLGTAEQRTGDNGNLPLTPLDRRYSVEFGGAYSVAPRLSVSGGVRYKLAPTAPTVLDINRPDQSVYLGTNIAF